MLGRFPTVLPQFPSTLLCALPQRRSTPVQVQYSPCEIPLERDLPSCSTTWPESSDSVLASSRGIAVAAARPACTVRELAQEWLSIDRSTSLVEDNASRVLSIGIRVGRVLPRGHGWRQLGWKVGCDVVPRAREFV